MQARHLLKSWETIVPRVRAAKSVLLFLDFDGTLVPVSNRRRNPQLAASVRRVLQRLAHDRQVRVVILSGRRRAELLSLVQVDRLKYLGLFGGERARGLSLPPKTRDRLKAVRACLTPAIRGTPGTRLENKRHTLALHYAEATPATIRKVGNQVRQCLKNSAPRFHIEQGHKVWEIVPPELGDKAAAVRAEMRDGCRSALVICAGDTEADEQAFAALREAITIRVGSPRRTRARYWLRDPSEVQIMLERLAETRK